MAEATSPVIAMDKAPKNFKRIKSNQTNSASEDHQHTLLLPGLPNHLAQLSLSTLHPSLLSAVCRSWRRLIYSPSFPPFFTLYALLSPTTQANQHLNSVELFSLDPISSTWQPLPSPPQEPPLRLLHRHPSFISRNLPIQSVSVSSQLVLIAATNHLFRPALPYPLVFNPLSTSNHWLLGPPLPFPRRWCVTGSMGSTVYVASGVGSHYHGDVARSMEKWEINKKGTEWKWEKMAGLKDGRFSREAVEAIGYKGKLYMVNVKGNSTKQGGVYDVAENQWEKMPEGMLRGWSGPVGANVDNEENMYVVDEKKGMLSKYDSGRDNWEKILESSEYLKGAEQIVVGRGRVCVVCANGRRIVVVDVVTMPPRTWVVNPPLDMEVVGLHILPRVSLPE